MPNSVVVAIVEVDLPHNCNSEVASGSLAFLLAFDFASDLALTLAAFHFPSYLDSALEVPASGPYHVVAFALEVAFG